jgi:tetratricopeptide (TPR) repeat protein
MSGTGGVSRPARGGAAAALSVALLVSGSAGQALLACQGSGSAPAPAPSPSGAASSAAASPSPSGSPGASDPSASGGPSADTEIGRARLLALAKPTGNPAVDKQIELLQERAKKLPKNRDLWILLGRLWVRKARESADPGYYLNANACADIVLEMEKGDRLARGLRVMVLTNEHKFADARDLAEQILVEAPEDLTALGMLSDALLEMGRFQEAAAAAQKMVDLKPGLPSYSRVSYIRWLKGDIEGAKQAIRQAIDARDAKDPEPGAWATVQAAMIFWHLGDYGGADKGFDVALEQVVDYPPALVGKGRSALAQGQAARAAELFAKAYKDSPLVETAWLLGDAREAAGDAAGAAEAYEKVVKTGRQTDGRTLAQFYATKGRDTEEALRLAEAELKIREDIYTHDTRAWALYRAGKLTEARAASDAAIALGTKDAKLLYHAGAIRIKAGDRAGGEKLVREALKLNPKFDWTGAAEAEKLLREGGAESPGTPKAAGKRE